jgi:lysocardiolipin and lysophospholipid acyltransferase
MYWQRFALKDMPLDDAEKFDLWLRQRWQEKDDLMEQYLTTGRFPPNASATNGASTNGSVKEDGFIETEVKLGHWWEVLKMGVVLATAALITNIGARVWNLVLYGKQY